MDSKVCECCQELTGGFPLCLDQFFFEKNDLQRPKMLKKWFLVIFKAHSPLRQKNGIFKRDQTQNHACLTQTNDFIPYTNIYNQIIIWGPYLAISGHCETTLPDDKEDDEDQVYLEFKSLKPHKERRRESVISNIFMNLTNILDV